MNKQNGYGIIIIIVAITLLVGAAAGYFIKQYKPVSEPIEQNQGSVGNLPYRATTTPENAINTDALIDTGAGTLGSVIITTAGNAAFNLLNATTTDITKRTGGIASSTIIIASFPASATVGTYTFDASYAYGLYFDVISGTLGTTTITYK